MKKPILELLKVHKTYDDGFIAVDDFNLKIEKGEFVTLLGPSGCGKTTMLKIIGGFTYPTKGKILYNGIDIKDMDITKRPTSTVFQDYALFPNMTVKQNIEYGLKLMRSPIENIDKNFSVQAEKIFLNSKKIAQKKIIEIEKKRQSIKKDIDKGKNKYNKNPFLQSIKEMRRAEFLATLDSLYEKLEEKYGHDYVSKISWKNKFLDFINTIFFNLKINFQFKISKSNMNSIEKEIYNLKKWYYYKGPIDKKFISLNEKYDDLDYDVSYWENYPDLKKEAFEKRNLTRKLTKEEINERANKVIKLVGLVGKESAYPDDLSGGMQQRVALARSIVIEPEILLLDEPLGALDAKVRKQLQNEIKRLHKELGLTFILVTHDQEEALMLSDKIVVMSNGKIEQIGTPNEIYDTPKNLWVANFIGRTNIFSTIALSEDTILFESNEIKICSSNYNLVENEKINVVIRPEDLKIVDSGNGFIRDAKIIDVIYKGLMYDIKCIHNNNVINVESIHNFEINKIIDITFDPNDVHIIKEIENE